MAQVEAKVVVPESRVDIEEEEEYSKEYEQKENEVIQLKREAKLKGGFYVELEAKLLFIVCIRGINAMDPKTRKMLKAPLGGFKKKRNHYVEGGDAGNSENYMNELIWRIN
ncbi:hypothetical protein Q3G72_007893 [Acer saccharum]|nr:hypothetical protein Q3G72_007893 [Acer saccharum]